MANLRLGTSTWKYDSWRGIVYSDNPARDYLREYSKLFTTVEIDQWYWSLFGLNKLVMPKKDIVRFYKSSVPKDFKFTVKIPNSITLTHLCRNLSTDPLIPNPHFLSEDLLFEFLEAVKPMKENLGPLTFQFDYFNKQKMKSQFEFQGLIREFNKCLPAEFDFGIETRTPDYLNETYFQFLREHKLGHVFLQDDRMPPVFDVYKRFKDYIKNFTIIHLYGPDGNGIETRCGGEWNKIIDPKNQDLEKIAGMIRELQERNIDVYVSVNNQYEGSAPLTINRIKKYLES
jgi:uncharacterized protein YecE (DUF72 family)